MKGESENKTINVD